MAPTLRLLLPALLALAACDPLLDYTLGYQWIWIESPADDVTMLGASTFPIEIGTSCPRIAWIDILVNDQMAAWGTGTPCGDGGKNRCFDVEIEPAMRTGKFWPARVEARLLCTGHAGTFLSDPISVRISPFEHLWFVPARATSLVRGGDDLVAVSGQGLHRLDVVTASEEITTFASRATAPRAFRVDNDVYYHATCDDPLRCDATSPDLFRIAAPMLSPTGDRARLGCAPVAVAGAGADRRVMVLGECDQPRVRWSAADLGDPVEATLDANPTSTVLNRNGEVTFLAMRGDELVIEIAGESPPVVTRATGVRATRPATAISEDGARATVLDSGTGALTHVDVATGAAIATAALPPHAPEALVDVAFVPGGHRVLVSFVDSVWLVDGDAPAEPPRELTALLHQDLDHPMTMRGAVAVDADRIAYVAAYDSGTPAVFMGQGDAVHVLATLGTDWTLSAPPLLRDGALYLAFDTARGPVIVQQLVAPLR